MRLKVLFIPTANTGVTFYRMYNFWKAAHRTGLADFHVLWWQKEMHEMHPWQREIHDPSLMWRITKEMNDWVIQSDIIIIGTMCGPGLKVVSNKDASQEYVINSLSIFRGLIDMRNEHFKNKVILTESDDNVVSTPEYNPAYNFYAPEAEIREVALNQFKESDGLIVSTPYLKETYMEFNSNIHVVPNCIDFNLWDNLPKKNKKGIRIGWAGAANHEEDLRVMQAVIPAITRKYKDVKFVFMHGCPSYLKKLPGVDFKQKWIAIDKYPKYLASQDWDIGIAPLVDNAFNRSKSNLRWLEYSALGIPTVASNVGHFKETVNLGQDALLVNDISEWIGALSSFIENKSYRKSMGRAAHARVRKDYNVDKIVRSYIEILKTQKLCREVTELAIQ